MKLFLFIASLLSRNILIYNSCLASSLSLFNYMATKTPYFKHPMSPAHDALSIENSNLTEGYEVVHMDALYRHGSRYPGKGKLSFWKSILEKLSQVETANTLKDILKSWNQFFPPNLNYSLHEVGWTEMQKLAEQSIMLSGSLYAKIFQMYKNANFSDFTFLVYTSPKSRVVSSADSFMTFLLCHFLEERKKQSSCTKFQQSKYLQDLTGEVVTYGGVTMIVDRKKMRPFDECERFLNRVKNNESAAAEIQKFYRSKPFNDVRYAVSNYFAGNSITSAEIFGLYQLCSFLLALHDNTVICNFLNDNEMKVMEYAADMSHYYRTGYGYSINYQFSCKLLLDIMAKLHRAKIAISKGKNMPSVVLRFGHAETLIPFLCLLGLYKDEAPLTSASFEMHRESRLFRTGTFSPFAGHVVFLLLRSVEDSSLKVAFVVSGQYVKMPLDSDCYLCNYGIVRKYFKSVLGRFNCNTVCLKVVHDEL